MNEWRTDAAAVRAVLADHENVAEPVTADRLLELGYVTPSAEGERAAVRRAAQDARLLRVAMPAPEALGDDLGEAS